jgi:ribosomal protein S18 acetylase RimI-like enzyme
VRPGRGRKTTERTGASGSRKPRERSPRARSENRHSDFRLTRKSEILAFLQTDRLYAGYAIGDLEPGLFGQCEWFGARPVGVPCAARPVASLRQRRPTQIGRASARQGAVPRLQGSGGSVASLALVFHGFKPSVLFLMGEPAPLAGILLDPALPRRIYLNCREEHLAVAGSLYAWDGLAPMWRMSLGRLARRPRSAGAVKIGPEDAQELVELYALGGGGAFDPDQMRRGVYYGVIAGGSIVSVAGTHLVSPTYGIAAIGNVFTHPDWRGRGFAKTATGAVASALRRRGIRDVILNVSQANHAAVHVYEDVGFKRHCAFFEGPASA